MGDGDPHLVNCFLGPQESSPQIGCQSIRPFLHSARVTDILTDAGIIGHNSPHLMRLTRPNNNKIMKHSGSNELKC